MADAPVLGVDACKAGWVGVGLSGRSLDACVSARIEDLVALVEPRSGLAVVAVDMPIGLPDRGRRRADFLAKAAVGPRRASVFARPVRAAVDAPDHSAAVAINQRIGRRGSLGPGIRPAPQATGGERLGTAGASAGRRGAPRGELSCA
ncbi:MAG TPA: DUF429 domain-containing protein, partial [Kribbellaceae bacterium]